MKKRQHLQSPAWFPYPSSWLKALILAWWIAGINLTIDRLAIAPYLLTQFAENREFSIVVLMGILLLQIPAIALVHHLFSLFFHLFIPQFILPVYGKAWYGLKKRLPRQLKSRLKSKRKSRRSPSAKKRSFAIFPRLINWWAGLYSWLVFILSTIIAVTLYTLLLPWFELSYERIIFNYKHFWETDNFYQVSLWISLILIWITAAAILYQIESLFKQKIIWQNSVLTAPQKLKNKNIEETVPIVVELNKNNLRGKSGKNKSTIDIHIKLPEEEVLTRETLRKIARVSVRDRRRINSSNSAAWKQIFVLLIVAILAGGIYGIYQRENSVITSNVSPQNNVISTKVIEKPREKPSPPPSQTTVLPPPDPFSMAVNRATNASEMTQQASTRIEWEAVASQWQDAVELMKVVPAFHPNYRVARQKAIEYQYNANYARRVAANSRE